MPADKSSEANRSLARVFEPGVVRDQTDAQLVDRFAQNLDGLGEQAFAVLVARHGSLVVGLARRVLGDRQAAEDVFQATFLILARRAGTIAIHDSLGPWLYQVARRLAVRARRTRREFGTMAPTERGSITADAAEVAELRAALDDEIGRLPGRLRDAVVLCLLEGQTLAEAARQMGCAVGTIGSRLNRARRRLRARLQRRGLAPVLGLLDGAGVPPVVSARLVRTAVQLGRVESVTASPSVMRLLARGPLKEMMMIRGFAVVVGLAGCCSVGSVLARYSADQESGVRLNSTRSPVEVRSTEPAHRPVQRDPTRIATWIATLRQTDPQQVAVWGTAIRELALIGRPAVPALTEEMDRTTDGRLLSLLAFTLRAIGDPRAVPALIRAIPRTFVAPDRGRMPSVPDADLCAFLQGVSIGDERSLGPIILLWTPYVEVTETLQGLSNRKFAEDQLRLIPCGGSPTRQAAGRRLFRQLAAGWADWWATNWRQYTDDPAFASANLPPVEPTPPVRPQPFPIGPDVHALGGRLYEVLGPPQPIHCLTYQDLDTGLESPWPIDLGDRTVTHPEDLAAWAAGVGYDLEGVTYRPPGSDRSFFALRAIGLHAWQVDDALYETITDQLRAGQAPRLDQSTGELLLARDPSTGAYVPEREATFLFVTREGSTGILRTTGQATRLLGAEPSSMPKDQPGSRHFYRGAQFQHKIIVSGNHDGP